MKRTTISPRLDGLLEEMNNRSIRHMIRSIYKSEKSYCGNSDLLLLKNRCSEKRNISADEFKKQRDFIIAYLN